MINALNALLGSETRAAVLGHLLLRPEQEVHLRELVRITGFSPRSVNKEVDRLVSAGFLLERRSSNRRYLRANKGHQLFKELHDIIDKTVGIVPAIEAVLAQERGIKLALLFGSAAAGSEGPTSDVDLLVVGSISLARVLKVTRAIQERTGREINPVVMDAQEFRRRRANKEHFISSMLDGPTLTLVGELDVVG
jgi:predicted nucleotidyltransferase